MEEQILSPRPREGKQIYYPCQCYNSCMFIQPY